MQERLLEDLEAIAGERHLRTSPAHHAAVALYLERRFTALGLRVEKQPVPGPFGTGTNLIARRQGADPRARTWIAGAHYDTVVGTPGADDNGIAVAGLLELARRLATSPTRDTIELVAWDLEEVQTRLRGGLLGSRLMAREARRAGRDLAGVISLEMIGLCRREPGSQRFPRGLGAFFPGVLTEVERRDNRGDFLAIVANRKARPLVEALQRSGQTHGLPLVSLEVRGVGRLLPALYRSDHAPFWLRGYPALMLTDTADFRSGHYHTSHDTIETVDLGFAAAAIETTWDALLEVAGSLGPNSPGGCTMIDEEERMTPRTDQAWEALKEYFENDDGSLPEIELRNLRAESIQQIFTMLWNRARDVTQGGARFFDRRDDRVKPIVDATSTAMLVCTEQAEPIHVVFGGIQAAGTTIPDLGIAVDPESVTLDYRMGEAWGPSQLTALLALIRDLAEIAPEMQVRHREAGEVFTDMWQSWH